jgi:hypothetical protein
LRVRRVRVRRPRDRGNDRTTRSCSARSSARTS